MSETATTLYERFRGTSRSSMVEEDANFETRVKGYFTDAMHYVNTLLKWWYTENAATKPTTAIASIPDDVVSLYWHAGAATASLEVLRSPEIAAGHQTLFSQRYEMLAKQSGIGKGV